MKKLILFLSFILTFVFINAQSWELLQGTGGKGITSFIADDTSIIASTFDKSIIISKDQGKTWMQLDNGIIKDRNGSITLIPTPDNQNYCFDYYHGIYKYEKLNKYWKFVSRAQGQNNFTVLPNGNIISASINGVNISKDTFKTFSNIKQETSNINLFCYGNNQNFAILGIPYQLWSFDDDGNNWTRLISNIPSNQVYFNRASQNLIITSNNKIYKTTSKNRMLSQKLMVTNANFLNVIRIDDKNIIAFNSNGFHYRSNDEGESWIIDSTYSSDLRTVKIESIHNYSIQNSTDIIIFNGSKLHLFTNNQKIHNIGENNCCNETNIQTNQLNSLIISDYSDFKISNNLGLLWKSLYLPTYYRPFSNYFQLKLLNDNTILRIDDDSIHNTINNGLNWNGQKLPRFVDLSSKIILNTNKNEIIIQKWDSIYISNNLGLSWKTNQIQATNTPITDLKFNNNLLIYSTQDSILFSSNYGLNANGFATQNRFPKNLFVSDSNIIYWQEDSSHNTINYYTKDFGKTIFKFYVEEILLQIDAQDNIYYKDLSSSILTILNLRTNKKHELNIDPRITEEEVYSLTTLSDYIFIEEVTGGLYRVKNPAFITGNNNIENTKIELKPNPASNYIYFDSKYENNIKQIKIIDNLGIVNLIPISNMRSNEINISSFKNGRYTLIIELKNEHLLTSNILILRD